MARTESSAYFRRTSSFWALSITLAIGYYTWTVFWPDQVPYRLLGPLGSLSQYLVEQHYSVMYCGWWLALMIHIGEALYSLKVCSDKGVDSPLARCLWCTQTLMFGIASLSLLLSYKPGVQRKRH